MNWQQTKKLRILFIGKSCGTSRHRAHALIRLGYDVRCLNPWDAFPKNVLAEKFFSKLVYEFGAHCFEPFIRHWLKTQIQDDYFQVVWNDQCTLLGPNILCDLKDKANYIITYSLDDPFGNRDKNRFKLYRSTLKFYNLTVVVRDPNIAEAFTFGAKNVLKVTMSADEVEHAPKVLTPYEKEQWDSEVSFIGTWMPERGPFLSRLVELGIPLRIYGDRWQKAKEWPTLKKAWRGYNLPTSDYVKAIQSTKICIGLLSKGNRDQYTHRSVEIPYIGSLLCAERTKRHLLMYREDKEAIFWNTPEECAQKCFALLDNSIKREAITNAGQKRNMENNFFNESVIKNILYTLFK